ncbi:uncharacterized protein LOC107749785 [Sinocyclocheilus rhinocerous]|uniref:uncharacterized protein LOC107749785 n=1 Tax=Sinocyclocheilus rhinocerous TaxID=307959 RepID=UPI0007BA406F|nr:PREDICTED: uncharacterized protein LOC107749785 [Sinocyclocheilus rhinocerous]XP_016420444.1 PREDICTED: uncharacterized protein LOC107749785 [Sinocyclocheilus rhinocerous]XP_016420445.1 PREDICTED: uncharacterized protein LOC107749785 [Sinocyclocheilus rhinocerous]
MFTFYKSQPDNWARPFFVLLRGDAAIGDGVKRYFLSQVISRVQFGFALDFDNCGKTLFFTGQEDHLVPSTSRILLDSDLFRIVGRMIGHSFINGGPSLTGLSPAMFGIITGQMNETVIIELEDCPDTDVIEIVHLLQKPNTLADDECVKVNDLAVSWDLPRVTAENRLWLAQSILHHAVIGHREKQMQQLKKGLKDTGVLRMVKERPSLIEVLFPRSSSLAIDAQMILERVIWPNPDSDDEENFSLETCCKITSFFRQYIEEGTPQDLKNLVEFWVGWTSLPQELYVKVLDVRMPTASTCRETLKLPLHYSHYDDFSSDLKAAVSSNSFGLV